MDHVCLRKENKNLLVRKKTEQKMTHLHPRECWLARVISFNASTLPFKQRSDLVHGLLRADVAVDEDNGRVFGVGRIYNPDLGVTGSLHVRAFNEDGDTLWSFQEFGWHSSTVNSLACLC